VGHDASQTPTVTNQPFSFEVQATVSEADYLARSSVARPRSKRARIYLIAGTILGVASLFSIKTAALGGIVLAICAFAWTAPRWSRWGARQSYASYKYLHGPLTYGVSDQKLWFRGPNLYSESTWQGLAVWKETDGVLLLSAHGVPELYFNVADLRAAGVYEQVRDRFQRHGVEFDAPKARRSLAAT
jgi:hypothetical protein